MELITEEEANGPRTAKMVLIVASAETMAGHDRVRQDRLVVSAGHANNRDDLIVNELSDQDKRVLRRTARTGDNQVFVRAAGFFRGSILEADRG